MKQSREKLNRIVAILLTAVMTLSISGYALEAVYAEDGDDQTEVTVDQQKDDDQKDTDQKSEEKKDAEQKNDAGKEKNEEGTQQNDVEVETLGTTGSDQGQQETPGSITMNAKNEDGSINVVWKRIDGADYYKAYLDDDETEDIIAVKTDADKAKEAFNKRFNGVTGSHTVTVKAFKKAADEDQDELLATGTLDTIPSTSKAGIGNHQRDAINLQINLKSMAGESHGGYSVVQGGCTDGTYAYYLMVSTYNQNGRILKTRLSDNAVVAVSNVIDIEHGNGMTYDKKNDNLVIIGRESWKNTITTVDAETLSKVTYKQADYDTKAGVWQSSRNNGLAAISYVPEYDRFIAQQRGGHDLLVIENTGSKDDPHYVVCGFIGTTIQGKYPGTYQAMDADERYVYLLLSKYENDPKRQPNNRILVLDWNAEYLDVATSWKCKNDGSGEPDADIVLNTPYEAENIYHIDRGDGTADFYLSEYHNNPKTEYVYEQQTYKVKWKKVWKKVPVQKKYKKKVKWKKVQKKNGKWKWKYKKVTKYKTVWKKKKVWKYKTKTKTVKVKHSYFNRDDYVYRLGNF